MSEGGTDGSPTQVAIARQGGGSHTAFTAGVLEGLFREWRPDWRLVGISGTSRGAFNALVAWHGLVTGGPERAAELLDALWADLVATRGVDRLANDWLVGLSRIGAAGVPLPAVSPYLTPGSRLAQDRLVETLERHVDLDGLADRWAAEAPLLVVGTVDINRGVFETFVDEAVTPRAMLASAAVPELFEAVELHGHYHWGGLFSQNPPIDDLLTIAADRKPEELWVVQINPQERAGEPTSLGAIRDRRNELAGNLSLNQELRTVERVDEWIDRGHLPESEFQRVAVDRIEMDRAYACSTKLDRAAGFVEELIGLGERRAVELLAERADTPAGPDTD